MTSPPPLPGTSTSAAAARWRGWPEVRADLRGSVGLVLALGVVGVPAGLLWWLLAPRADFNVTDEGPVVIGMPGDELLVADDSVYVLVLAGVGLLMGAGAWLLRRRRGVATMIALPLGALLAAAVAWQLGEMLGTGPTQAELESVGTQVTTPLTLGSLPALAVAPFTAILAHLVAVVYAAHDDLGRVEPTPPARTEHSHQDALAEA